MTMVKPQCSFCSHFHSARKDGDFCDAFPDKDGIPVEIILNEVDHRKPYPGDNGIRFDQLTAKEQRIKERGFYRE